MNKVHIVVAMAKNNVIGKNNKMLWVLPEDMKRFRKLTLNRIVVMGRKTFESIGRPLDGRVNVIVSRQPEYRARAMGCPVVNSIEAALKWGGDKYDVYVIGGAEIYKQVMPKADTLHVTKIDHEYEGDACFPEIDSENIWKVVECGPGSRSRIKTSEYDFPYDYWFMVYERRSNTQ